VTTAGSPSSRAIRARAACAAVAAVVTCVGSPRLAAAAEDVPLPLTGRQTVRAEGRRYVVDGKQTIPPGSVIRVEANVLIVGKNGASLDVRGGLRVHGIPGSRVRIQDVDFSPSVSPDNELHFDEVSFHGCTFAHSKETAYAGGFTLENASFGGGPFTVRIRTGFLRVMSVEFSVGCTVEGVANTGRPPEVALRTSTLQAVTLLGPMTATVRSCEVKGLLEARDFGDLVVDGCDLPGGAAFRQGPGGVFSRLVLTKCNLLDGARLVLHRPTGPKTKAEKVRIDKFHFGRTDGADMTDGEIAGRIDDGADDEAVSVRAFWQNPKERPH
jgi:hypothetical protein